MEHQVTELNLNDILPNRFQPRIRFNETSINELAESIKEHGVIQPIVVRRIGDKYEIIAGERRYKASVMAGKTTIPAIITELNDKDSAEVALIENVQRQNLTPIEEAISYKKILDMGYLTQEALAEKLGKNQSTIANKLRLLNLSDEVQDALLNEKISERHARSLLKINDHKQQNKMLEKIITERLTVRKTDEEIKNMLNNNDNIEVMIPEKPQENSTPINNVSNSTSVNIPTSPIIEDNSAYNPTPVIDIAPISTPDISSPGFVDVNKIENQAQDINIEKPLANIESLLKPEDILVSEPEITPTTPISPVEPSSNIFTNNSFLNPLPEVSHQEVAIEENHDETDEASLLKPGKFFNIMDAEAKKEETMTSTSIPSSESTVKEEIDFSKLFAPKTPEPISFESTVKPMEPEKEVTTPIEPKIETPSINSIDSTINFNRPMPTYEPVYDLEEEEPKVPTSVPESSEPQTAGGFRQVIKIIRNSEQQIEQAGYVIEMEEFDFDDMYQVIFKIKK